MAQAYDFGERIKKLRLEKGLSQPQVAKRIGVSKTVISNYESNYKFPSTENLIKLANLFNTTTDYLLGLDHEWVVDLNGLTEHQKKFLKNGMEALKQEFIRSNDAKEPD